MTTTSTCPRCTGRVRRRLHAIEVLLGRWVLLAVAGFLLFIPPIAQIAGVLLGIYVIGAGAHATFSSFHRAWTAPSHRSPRRGKPDVLDGPPLMPIAVDRDGNARYRSTPRGDGGTDMSHQCRHCVHPLAAAGDHRDRYWVHADTGLTRCPEQPCRRRQIAEPATHPRTRADVALAGGDQ
jgi:hypothetical protein